MFEKWPGHHEAPENMAFGRDAPDIGGSLAGRRTRVGEGRKEPVRNRRRSRSWRVEAVAAFLTLCVSGSCPVHAAVTTNVTWSGGGGAGNPYWSAGENWLDGEPPANPTPSNIVYSTYGQVVTGVVDADWQVGGIQIGSVSVGTTHTLDLGGRTLTVTNRIRIVSGYQSMANTFVFSNGTVRLGSDGSPAWLEVNPPGNLRFAAGCRLETYNVQCITGAPNAYYNSSIDLRGAEVVGGVLHARQLVLGSPWSSWFGVRFFINSNTVLSAISVSNRFSLGRVNVNDNGPQYIGDPADTFTWDGCTFGCLPTGVSLRVGVDAANRADMLIAEDLEGHSRALAAIRARGGGAFTGYLTKLHIGARSGTGVRKPRGLLHLQAMDSCFLDCHELLIATGRVDAAATDSEIGELWLPAGTAVVGNVVIGAVEGMGYGRLCLSNTIFTVTNSFVLRRRSDVAIRTGAQPAGLDIARGFSDAGGTVRVFFVESPAAATNWAIRIQGDAVAVLQTMYGAGRLITSGSYPGKVAGVLYDATSNVTYFALAESNAFPNAPVAIAHDEKTWEWAAGWPVVIATNDINLGSYDPLGRPLGMALMTNGGSEVSTLTLDAVGDYDVILRVYADSSSASDTCVVHVVNVPSGISTGTLTWCGGASTPLMDRREWMWSGNWKEGSPPANPCSGTLVFRYDGQAVTSRLEQSRTIARLNAGESGFTTAHTLDLGGNILTVTDRLTVVSGGTTTRQTLNLTNGTIRLGTDESEAWLEINPPGTMRFCAGVTLDTYRVACVTSIPNAYGDTALDLRGARIAGGKFRTRHFVSRCVGWYGARMYLDGSTEVQTLEVTENLTLGLGEVNANAPTYIGNPADTIAWEGKTFGRLPPNVALSVGVAGGTRAKLTIGEHSIGSGWQVYSVIAASSGGAFTAYLSSLTVGGRSGSGTRSPRGLLDCAAMNSCAVDAQQLLIAPGSDTAAPTDDERGDLRLPPGSVVVGAGTVGAVDGTGYGRLQASNTTIVVTNGLAIRKTGRVTLYIGASSCGLVISNASPAALDMSLATNGALTIRFVQPPGQAGLHYGFRWAGDHAAAIGGWMADGRIVVDDSGLGSKRASVFKTRGETFIGIPSLGTVFVVK